MGLLATKFILHIFNIYFFNFFYFINSYVLDNPSLVAGKSVLDVGSGCGASAVAALIRNAKYVVANDIDEGKHSKFTKYI